MGGLNQDNRYGTSASAAYSHHHATSATTSGNKQMHSTKTSGGASRSDAGFAMLPEYQAQRPQNQNNNSKPHQQQYGGGGYVAPAANHLRPPRQHVVPAVQLAQQQQSRESSGDSDHSATAATMIESPTGSATSSSNNSKNDKNCFHYNPYDTQSSRVACPNQQQQQYQSHSQGSTPPASLQYQQQPQFPSAGDRYTAAPQHQNGGGYYCEEYQQPEPVASTLPYGTLHGQLEGIVSFVSYPTEEFHHPGKESTSDDSNSTGAAFPKEQGKMSRLFLGQLPYQVTDMQLDWLCFTFGQGGAVQYPERITKHDPMRGCKVPTGCIHAYADNDCVQSMLNAMHKRILVDDTGVWFAETQEQYNILNDYCMMMKNDRTKRYQNRPYDTVVAQFATSSFVRRPR